MNYSVCPLEGIFLILFIIFSKVSFPPDTKQTPGQRINFDLF